MDAGREDAYGHRKLGGIGDSVAAAQTLNDASGAAEAVAWEDAETLYGFRSRDDDRVGSRR